MKNKKYALIIFLLLILSSTNIFSYEKGHVTINCQVMSNEANIGNAEIIFFSVDNIRYTFKSNFLGKVTAQIPHGKYRVSVFRNGKEIADNSCEEIFYRGKEYNLIFNLGKEKDGQSSNVNTGYIQGAIYDEEKNNISDVKITFKSPKGIKTAKSNENGNFNIILPVGNTIVTAIKGGYLDGGTILEVKKGFPMTNVEIILRKNRYILEGIITDGVRALRNIGVAIYDPDFNKIQETQTDQYGHYEFLDIRGYDKVYVSIENGSYKRYRSGMVTFKEKNNIMNIILEKK